MQYICNRIVSRIIRINCVDAAYKIDRFTYVIDAKLVNALTCVCAWMSFTLHRLTASTTVQVLSNILMQRDSHTFFSME